MGKLNPLEFIDAITPVTATIAISTALAPAVDLGGATLVALHMPAAWTAAAITFQVSEDNVTFDNLYDASGAEKSLTVAASRVIYLAPYDWIGFRYIKVRSGTNASPVNQTAAASIVLIARPNLG